MTKGFFITGTDTDVGKTTVAIALLQQLNKRGFRTAAMKPVACGCSDSGEGLYNDDALRLMQTAGAVLPYSVVNPYAFKPPLAPHIAAASAGIQIDLQTIEKNFRSVSLAADYVIVEGVGGWKVPLNDRQTSADMAGLFALPVIMVVGMRPGCLNHALLTADSIIAEGCRLGGWIANGIERDFNNHPQTIAALVERLDAPLLGVFPYSDNPIQGSSTPSLDIDRLLLIKGSGLE